jgi:hypothetical protein
MKTYVHLDNISPYLLFIIQTLCSLWSTSWQSKRNNHVWSTRNVAIYEISIMINRKSFAKTRRKPNSALRTTWTDTLRLLAHSTFFLETFANLKSRGNSRRKRHKRHALQTLHNFFVQVSISLKTNRCPLTRNNTSCSAPSGASTRST